MVKLKQSGETKPLQLAAAHPDMPDCTGGSRLGRREMWLSLAHTGPRSCICSCLRNLPFLSFYWGKGRWKGTLFIPHPSCLSNLNLLNHRWIVVLWVSAKGGPPLWDVLWAVLHQALDQGGLSGVMTWCKSTKTGPRISGRKGCWWGISCEKRLGLKQNWLWREKVLSDERAHHISCPGMFWMFGVGIKLETGEETIKIALSKAALSLYSSRASYLQAFFLSGHISALRKLPSQIKETPHSLVGQPAQSLCATTNGSCCC